jgi:hypothetical protein
MNTIRNRGISCFFILSVLLPLFHTTVWSATFSLNPAADAFVTTGPSGNLANNNYGGAGALCVAAPGLPGGEFQSLLRFGLAGARNSFDSQFGIGQWSIQSVTLRLTATSPLNPIFNNPGAGQFSVSWMQNDGWTEGTGNPNSPNLSGISFATLNSFLGPADETLGTFNFNGATSGNATWSLNLTPSFSAEILAGGTISLRMFAASSTVSYLFNSANFGSPTVRPLLTIGAVAVPEPSPLALSLIVLGNLAFWRLSFRKRS